MNLWPNLQEQDIIKRKWQKTNSRSRLWNFVWLLKHLYLALIFLYEWLSSWPVLFMEKCTRSIMLPNFRQKFMKLWVLMLWEIYDMISYTIMNIQHARMFYSKCTRMPMNMLWWYDHDYSYERMHNCIWMKEEYMRSLHLEAVI